MGQPNFVTTTKSHTKIPKFPKQQKSALVFMENNTRQTQKNRTKIIDYLLDNPCNFVIYVDDNVIKNERFHCRQMK